MMPEKPRESFSDFIKRTNERIIAEQKHLWISKAGDLVTTSEPYTLIDGRRRTTEIDWYSEHKPFYANYRNYRKFCKSHRYIGKI